MKTYGGTAPCIPNLTTRLRWVLKPTPGTFTSPKAAPGTHQIGWAGPKGYENIFWLCRQSNPDSSAVKPTAGLWHRVILYVDTSFSEEYSDPVFILKRAIFLALRVHRTYWPLTVISPPTLPWIWVTTFHGSFLYNLTSSSPYSLRPWRWRQHFPPKYELGGFTRGVKT
jgi:hypothetical protein